MVCSLSRSAASSPSRCSRNGAHAMPPDSRQPRRPLESALNRPPGRPNPRIATAPSPADQQGGGQFRTDLSTFFTKPGPSEKIYTGDRTWARVTVTLQTAGPVAIGTKATITPVLSGKGILLQTGVPKSFDIAKSDNL